MRYISVLVFLIAFLLPSSSLAAQNYYQDQEVYQEQNLDVRGLYALSTYHDDVIYHTNEGYYEAQNIPPAAYREPVASNTGNAAGYVNAASYPVQANYNRGAYNAYANQGLGLYNAYANQGNYYNNVYQSAYNAQAQNDRFLVDAVSVGSALMPIVRGNINACTIANLLRRL